MQGGVGCEMGSDQIRWGWDLASGVKGSAGTLHHSSAQALRLGLLGIGLGKWISGESQASCSYFLCTKPLLYCCTV